MAEHVLQGARIVDIKARESLEEILIVSLSMYLAPKLKEDVPDFLAVKRPARIGIGLVKRRFRGREQLHLLL